MAEESRIRVGEEECVFRVIATSKLKYRIWWLLVYLDPSDGKLKHYGTLSSAPSWLLEVKKRVEKLMKAGVPLLLFAIWHGEHRTDAFLIDPAKFLEWVTE